MNTISKQAAPTIAGHGRIVRKILLGTPTRSLADTATDPPLAADAPSRERWLKMATDDIDRAGDMLVISGMDAADFLQNPQFLWQHGASGAQTNTIGKILRLEQTANALYALAEYADASASPLAEQIFRMDEAALLPANSIGFRPIEWEDNAFGGITFTKWQLIECSKVELPMNPKAVDDGAPNERSFAKAMVTPDAAAEWLFR